MRTFKDPDQTIEERADRTWDTINGILDSVRWKEQYGFESYPMEVTIDCDMRVLEIVRDGIDEAILNIKEHLIDR